MNILILIALISIVFITGYILGKQKRQPSISHKIRLSQYKPIKVLQKKIPLLKEEETIHKINKRYEQDSI